MLMLDLEQSLFKAVQFKDGEVVSPELMEEMVSYAPMVVNVVPRLLSKDEAITS